MKALKGIAKVALVILALPWVLVILGKVLSGSVINAYLAYASWVAGIAKSW